MFSGKGREKMCRHCIAMLMEELDEASRLEAIPSPGAIAEEVAALIAETPASIDPAEVRRWEAQLHGYSALYWRDYAAAEAVLARHEALDDDHLRAALDDALFYREIARTRCRNLAALVGLN